MGELTALGELDVAHNVLRALPQTTTALHELALLDVTHNQLRALPDSLSSLTALAQSADELSFESNSLSAVPSFALRHMPHLWSIDVSDNMIKQWPEHFADYTESGEKSGGGALAMVSALLSKSKRGRSNSSTPTPDAATREKSSAAAEAFAVASGAALTPKKAGSDDAAPMADVQSPPRPFGTPRVKTPPAPALLVPAALTELVLRNNRFATIAPSVEDLTHYVRLTRLDLSRNTHLRTVPQELTTLTALEHLDLSDCGALTELPADVSPWRRLSTLLLARTARLHALPPSLASLPRLTAYSLTHVSAAAPRPLGTREPRDAAVAGDGAADFDGCVPSRHCVGALSDAEAMRARYMYNTSLKLIGSAPHPLAGAMLLALATADGKRVLHNDGIKHMRALVVGASRESAASEAPYFRAVGAEFVARTLALLARDEALMQRLTERDSLALMLRLAQCRHHGVSAEVRVCDAVWAVQAVFGAACLLTDPTLTDPRAFSLHTPWPRSAAQRTSRS